MIRTATVLTALLWATAALSQAPAPTPAAKPAPEPSAYCRAAAAALIRGGGEAEMAAVRQALTPFDFYDYDSIVCPPHYGRIRQELEARGVTIGSMDLLIAAHALGLDATLVSNNLAHFSRVAGLKTANWLT